MRHSSVSFRSAPLVVFSGSRRSLPPASLLSSVFSAVHPSAFVVVGCASGVDHAVRRAFPRASVFFASSFGSGRASFARRSVAVVATAVGVRGSFFVSFPGVACPAGLLPSAVSSRCFCGLGSGSWASLAFAVGSGVSSLLWLPAGISAPVGWGFVPLGSGWWFFQPMK